MNFLEDQLRDAEVEDSPFEEDVPASESVACHWTVPELVAEVDFSGWTRSHTLSNPSLKWVTQRTAVRHAHWLKPPK
jgi:ATP-dependent DNA ligase